MLLFRQFIFQTPYNYESKIMLNRNDTLELTIEKLTYTGDGLARHDNQVIFVPQTAPGDRVEVEITELKKRFARAQLRRIIKPSPYRIEPPCDAFQRGCGGCQWLYLDYDAQLQIKHAIVQEALIQHHLTNVPVKPILGMDDPFHYRNKGTVMVHATSEEITVGFYEHRSNTIVDVFGSGTGECPVQATANNTMLQEVGRRLRTEHRIISPPQRLAFRAGTDGKISANLPPQWKNKIQTTKHARFEFRGYQFRVFGASFFQINTNQTEKLLQVIDGYLSHHPIRQLVDLFCGVGLFAICFAGHAEQVWGIESSRAAIKDAQKNQHLNQTSNINWILGRAERELFNLWQKEPALDTLILDPPREGCDKRLIGDITQSNLQRVVYVSCDPMTLIRDLKRLQTGGFQIVELQPIDMFPHTYHIECVAYLERD